MEEQIQDLNVRDLPTAGGRIIFKQLSEDEDEGEVSKSAALWSHYISPEGCRGVGSVPSANNKF